MRGKNNFIVIAIIVLTLLRVLHLHAYAQTPPDQKVPSDLALDIQQGEQELQQDPQALQKMQRIKQSEITKAFEDGVETQIVLQLAPAETAESVSELEPTPVPDGGNSTDNPSNNPDQNTTQNQNPITPSVIQPSTDQPSVQSTTDQTPSALADSPTPSPDVSTQVQGASTELNVLQQILRGIKLTFNHIF